MLEERTFQIRKMKKVTSEHAKDSWRFAHTVGWELLRKPSTSRSTVYIFHKRYLKRQSSHDASVVYVMLLDFRNVKLRKPVDGATRTGDRGSDNEKMVQRRGIGLYGLSGRRGRAPP